MLQDSSLIKAVAMDRKRSSIAPQSVYHPSLPSRRYSMDVGSVFGQSLADFKTKPTQFLVQWYKDLDRLFGMPMPVEIETIVYRGKG